MSSTICQNIVSSSFESQLTETTATLKLKVATALGRCRKLGGDEHSPRNEIDRCGFLLRNYKESGDKDCIYTHPLAQYSSFSKLSPMSLELCTESIGSESGSDTFSDCSSIFSASPPPSPTENHKGAVGDDWNQKKTTPENAHTKKGSRKMKDFPPPLTTMTGSKSLQVCRHREGGRLIIEAVEGPFRNSFLKAERSDGRLKLSFTTATSFGEGQEEGNREKCGGAAEEKAIGAPRNEVESEMEEFDGEINVMEKLQRLSRCKEGGHGNKGLCSNWKPAVWVATS